MTSFRWNQCLPTEMWDIHLMVYEALSRVTTIHPFDLFRTVVRGWTIPTQTPEFSLTSVLGAAVSDVLSISIY